MRNRNAGEKGGKRVNSNEQSHNRLLKSFNIKQLGLDNTPDAILVRLKTTFGKWFAYYQSGKMLHNS